MTTIVCRRVLTSQYKRGDLVIRSNATDEAHAGVFQHYCDDGRHCYIRYGDDTPVKVRTQSLLHIDTWRAMRKEQASLKTYWTGV